MTSISDLSVVILCGGLGTRLREETEFKPKPMVTIGGRPILWHIMMHYSTYGYDEFVVALGYKGEFIKKYMADYCSLNGNLTVDLGKGTVESHSRKQSDWKIDLVDTIANWYSDVFMRPERNPVHDRCRYVARRQFESFATVFGAPGRDADRSRKRSRSIATSDRCTSSVRSSRTSSSSSPSPTCSAVVILLPTRSRRGTP